jgi:MYXO-CTERM domain-containing protein
MTLSGVMQKRSLVPASSILVALLWAQNSRAATYYVATTGSDANVGNAAKPFKTIQKGAAVAAAGDTVFIHGGTYTGGVAPAHSGTAAAWITFSAFAGELPILDGGGAGGTGFGSATAQFIRVVGLAVRNWSSSAFSNGWVNDTGTSNGNWQFVQCVADGNGINGIAFYNATGLLVDQCIVAHNGNMLPSWSSGVNLFHVSGDYTTNVVTRTVSFENIDISTHHTDGSGFILDQNSSGALFENNLGFRNGGSCIRINTPGARLVNNTCYHDGLAPADIGPANPGEIYFSSGPQGALMINNLAAASGWNDTMNAVVNGPTGTSNLNSLLVNANGATPFFLDPANVDFAPASGSTTVIDKGTTTDGPATDIGFDPLCIKAQSGQAVSWWSYTPDYTYIASVGGVAGCFQPKVRPSGAAPDIGAYEFGSVGAGGSGGTSAGGTGGATGGASGTGGAIGGASGTGGATGGASGTGGAIGGASGRGGTGGTGGTPAGGVGGSGTTGGSGGVTTTGGAGGGNAASGAGGAVTTGGAATAGGSNAAGSDTAGGNAAGGAATAGSAGAVAGGSSGVGGATSSAGGNAGNGGLATSEGGSAGIAMSGAGGGGAASTAAGFGGMTASQGGMAMSSAGNGFSSTAGNGGSTSVPSSGGVTAAGGTSVNSNGVGGDDSSQTNGCSCRLAPERSSNSWAALALLGLATATLRRRRK